MTQSAEDLSHLLPIGSILPYAGVNPDPLQDQGWLVCNGAELERAIFPELFAQISTAFGSPGASTFNLPDLRGYFLRAVTGGTNHDPDVDLRTALQPGGNDKDRVGSRQTYGSAPAKSQFKIPYPMIENRSLDSGCTDPESAVWNSGSDTFNPDRGGDLETRSINKYVYFIIKYTHATATGKPVETPVGAIAAYAGIKPSNPLSNNWLKCDGQDYSIFGVGASLFEAIGYAHGQKSEDQFVVPDYRGYFLRGVASGSTVDPDRDGRLAPYPKGISKGNAGDAVGSMQGWATGLPVKAVFKTAFPHHPHSGGAHPMAGAVKYVWLYNKSRKDVQYSGQGDNGGGDKESRPYNWDVDWYIRSK